MNACSLDLLACVTKLREAGATIVWPKKPVRAPGLKWGKDGDAKVAAAADALWAKGVLACTPAEALAKLGIAPDVGVVTTGANDVKKISWLHRRDAGTDWYFTAMPNRSEATAELSFGQTGRVPELWDAETGSIAPADVWREEKGRTYVTIPYTVCGSKFVVFRKPAKGTHPAKFTVTSNRRPDPGSADSVMHTLIIKEARYGVIDPPGKTDPSHMVDVTAKLNGLVNDGELSVKVDNALAGRDPLFMTVKHLYVTYVYDGVEKQCVVGENELLTIPPGAGKPVPPPDGEWREGRLYAFQPLEAKATASDGNVTIFKAEPPPVRPVAGPWKVSFPNGFLPNKLAKGPDESVVFDRLASWSENANEGIRYFSGIATYRKTLDAAALPEEARLVLDLGVVKDFAEVTVNGKKLGVLWKPPFRVDITDAVRPGEKIELSIRAANLWANRLIGDDHQFADDCAWDGIVRNGVKEIGIREIPAWVKEGKKSPTGRCTFTTWKHWDKNDELLPSGLLGPVLLRTAVPAQPRPRVPGGNPFVYL